MDEDGAIAYLSKYKDALEKRDADTSAEWYEYGRSQAIKNLIGPKILISMPNVPFIPLIIH